MKWQEGGRVGVATCSCLHKAGALYLSFHLPQLTLICARSQANSRASPAPCPLPHSRPQGEQKMQSNKQIASRQLWRRETTDSYACSAFTLKIAAASNCATVQQQQLCMCVCVCGNNGNDEHAEWHQTVSDVAPSINAQNESCLICCHTAYT